MVPSGSPAPPHLRVISDPSMVPTVRFTLRMGRVNDTGVPCSTAGAQRSMRVLSRARSRPWSCSRTQRRATVSGTSGFSRIGDRSSPRAFQWSTAPVVSSRSTRPIISSMVRKPISAIASRTSSATKRK